jgi:curved DNA-binding protein CbpA
MSRHKKKSRDEKPPEVIKEIPIEDDPYWKVGGIYMDAHRVGRFLDKFERFEEKYPEWTDELLEGTPTFYCVLGVPRGTGKDEVKKAYDLKSRFSSYSPSIIGEAFEVLIDPKLQKEYDKLLFIFEQTTKCMPIFEKKELIKKHSLRIDIEKQFVRMGSLMHHYKNYLEFHINGMPDLYEIAGLDRNSSIETIEKNRKTDSELNKKIFDILCNPASREEYDFVLNFTQRFGDRTENEKRIGRKKRWADFDKILFEKIVLTAINDGDEMDKFKQRIASIINSNQDWLQYLPPSKETFFSILGIDNSTLPSDKKELEKVIREKYRTLEKTPEVNLAYSVLKNTSQREDYLYLMKNIDMLNATKKIYSDDEPVELPKKKQRRKNKKSPKKTVPHDQKTLDDLFMEIMGNILKKLK